MFNRPRIAAAFFAASTLLTPASALADGETQITHAKALAGNVTPGDAPGYPVIISIPGMFELASNLFVAANAIGIQVTSPHVTIDLNGFLMQGTDVAWYGIVGGVDAVTVRNGDIASFKFDGIHGAGKFWTVEDVRVLSSGRDGIAIPADLARIRTSTSSNNARNGIVCLGRCIAEGNIATENALDGIALGISGIALNNISSGNAGDGIQTSSSLVSGNQIASNGERGLFGGSLVTENLIHNNANYGIDGVPAKAGYGNNRLYNNGYIIGSDATNVLPLHPNVCAPDACP